MNNGEAAKAGATITLQVTNTFGKSVSTHPLNSYDRNICKDPTEPSTCLRVGEFELYDPGSAC